MLQVNTGRLTYPEYEINVTRPLFATEEDFMKWVYVYVQFYCMEDHITGTKSSLLETAFP